MGGKRDKAAAASPTQLQCARLEPQAALSALERKFSAAFEQSPLALIIASLDDRRLVEVNESFVRLSGYTREEAVGRTIEELGIWIEPEQRRERFARLLAGERVPNIETRYRVKSGEERTCVIGSALIEINSRPHVLNSIADITERKRAEMNLAILADISQDLVRLTNIDEMMRTVGAKIGAHLNLSLCAFVEINEAADEAVITHEWHREDAPGIAGVYRIADFVAGEFQRASRAGETFVVRDTVADPRADAERFATLNVGSFVSVPLIRDGQWRFLLCAFHSTAYDWRDDEVELIRELATRIWTRLERARTEENLRRSEGRFRAIVNQATAGITQNDPTGKFMFVNDRYCEIVGYSREELLELRMQDITDPKIVAANVELYNRVWQEGTPFIIEKQYIRKDGSRVWVNNSVAPVIGANGKTESVVCVTLDITERKRAEQALTEGARRQRALYQLADQLHCAQSLDAVCGAALDAILDALHCDRASILPLDNAGVMRFVGWRGLSEGYRKAVEGHSPWEPDEKNPQPISINDIDAAEISDSLKAVIKGEGIGSLAFIPLVSDGKLIGKFMIYFDAPHAFSSGEFDLCLTIARQLAFGIDRNRAEDALRESEERFRALADNMSQFAWMADSKGWIFWYNRRWFDYTGTALEEVEGWGWTKVHHPDHVDRVVKRIQHSWDTGELWEDTFPLRGKDGNYRWFLSRAVPIRGAEGRIVRWFGTNTDITEQRQAEQDAIFLSDLAERIRLADDEDELLRDVSRLIGVHLQVARCFFVEIDVTGDRGVARRGYHRDGAPTVSESRISDFSPETIGEMKAGRIVVNRDAQADPRTAAFYETIYRKMGERAYVAVPLSRAGRWAATLWVGAEQPRDWTPREVTLLETVAERTWLVLEKLRLDAELKEREERLRLATEAGEVGAWRVDLHTGLDTRNAELNRMLGLEAVTSTQPVEDFFSYIHPDDAARTDEAWRAALGGTDVYDTEPRIVRSNGEVRWVRDHGRVFRDAAGQPLYAAGAVVDITEERRVVAERERLLEESRRHSRTLQELNAASVAINAATSVDEISRLTIDKARELTGARMAVINLIPDGDWSRARTAASLSDEYAAWRDYDTQVTGEGIYHLVARDKRTMRMTQAELVSHPAWRGHGSEASKHPPLRGWLAAPLLDDRNECIGVVHLSDKWADGKASEFTEADEALLVQLAQVGAVALENQQLFEQEQEARQMAEQATRAKDEFLAVVSHELRSPLNAILGWNRLLRTQRGDDPEIAKIVETVERSGKAQLQLIEDLLDTARIISGKMKLEAHPVELVEVIASALDTVRPAANSKGVAIVPILDSEAGQITGDPHRLQQIVWNLMSNAIKFTPKDGRVWIELRRGGPGVQIVVRDTGQGINPDLLPYIFDRFKQGDSSTSRRFGGLGLGLALVKYLVELHGGSVMAESLGEGGGAIFTVSLPVRAVRAGGEAASRMDMEKVFDHRAFRGRRPASLSGVRALVVDDEAGARELLAATLEQHGALVTGVDSADAALAEIESRLEDEVAAPFDVLISDIGMPGADGYELVRRVRAHADERVSRIRAVALTAYARTEDRLRALQAGFQMHVPKPVDEEELTIVIAALTDRLSGGN
ncbi:MAG: PAS domain S-box protein [Blastocatellales bacterium]